MKTNWKANFRLIDGKPVPHVWTMPEEPNFVIDFNGDMTAESKLSYRAYQQAITNARENAIPIKEEFRGAVEDIIFNKYFDGNLLFKFNLTRDYDVDMEFEIEEIEEPIWGTGGAFKTTKKVAIPKQTKEIEPVVVSELPAAIPLGFKLDNVVPEQKENPIIIERILNAVHKSLQWEDGEISGLDIIQLEQRVKGILEGELSPQSAGDKEAQSEMVTKIKTGQLISVDGYGFVFGLKEGFPKCFSISHVSNKY